MKLRYGPEHSIGSVALETMRKNPDHITQVSNDKSIICNYTLKEIFIPPIDLPSKWQTNDQPGNVATIGASSSTFSEAPCATM